MWTFFVGVKCCELWEENRDPVLIGHKKHGKAYHLGYCTAGVNRIQSEVPEAGDSIACMYSYSLLSLYLILNVMISYVISILKQ